MSRHFFAPSYFKFSPTTSQLLPLRDVRTTHLAKSLATALRVMTTQHGRGATVRHHYIDPLPAMDLEL